MMKRMFGAAVSALLMATSALAAPQAALPDADPAMWVVKDADTTIYLFGTFHALDGKTAWFNDEVKRAFGASDEVVLEIIASEDPKAMLPIMQKYAIDRSGKPLSEKLSPKSRAKLAKALTDMGMPATAFDKLKPFFAALTLTTAQSQKLGMTGAEGSEATLTKAATASGKRLGNLETAEFQIKTMADLSEAAQIEMLEEALEEGNDMGKTFQELQAKWNAGDAEGFASMMQEMSASSPEAYAAVFTRRNATWAEWIDRRLDKPGTVFLAVGTGHLAGKDSVQNLLGKRGIASARAR